jgi:glycosyltransferase involved in cell wall biosynthesis
MRLRLRILFLLPQSLMDPYGLGRFWPLARQMTKIGYQVEIAALHPSFGTLRQRDFMQDGIKISYVAQMHVRRDGNRQLYFNTPQLLLVTTMATIALANAALKSRADAIHISKALPMNGLAGLLGARLRHRRLYLDVDDDEAASNRFGGEWQRNMVKWWEDRLPLSVRGITVNTSYSRDRCIDMGVPANHIFLVPNGFDPDRIHPVSINEIKSVRTRWNLSGKQVVLFLGSLNLANHPILLLLDAFEIVRAANPNATLLLVGGGEGYERVGKEIDTRGLSNSIVLAGRVDPVEVASIYAASHLVVDPVFNDNVARARCPLKIVESLAMGIPVVTGDIGDRSAMLDNGRAGILVEPGSADALAKGIINALDDHVSYENMAKRAKTISQQFRWDCLAEDFVKVYGI